MTKRTGGIHISTTELAKIVEWLEHDLMMSATSVKIIGTNSTGIGQVIRAIALDEHGKEIAKCNATEYVDW